MTHPAVSNGAYDVARIRQDFPILARLSTAARSSTSTTRLPTQKPRPVLDAMRQPTPRNANVHRGLHTLSQEATEAYEGARATIASFVNARSADEIVFVRGATEAINLVAATFGRHQMRAGDEIVVTELEHHSNIVPWQMLRDDHGVVLKVAPIDDAGDLLLDRFVDLLTDRTRLVCVTHVSNALGTITPIAEIVRLAHGRGARVLVDGCQAVGPTRRSTSRPSMPTSTSSRRTRCSARPGSAPSTASGRSSTGCHPTRGAAR